MYELGEVNRLSTNANSKVTIRPARLNDAEPVLTLEREVVGEGEFFIAVAEEYQKTHDEHQKWMQNIMENDRNAMFVADVDDTVVGLIVFTSHKRKRLAHTGSISIMIRKEHRNRGLGRLLLQELLNWAERHPDIEKVSLGVFSTNHRAIALYKSMGFVEEGRKINEFKLDDGEYSDDILMYKFV
ncbi:N-acetyltransferase [Brevibacillus fluminis]|uniref:N-acetyltransferase n=1 Tax=Brevibacillus fluminis TaxID=511487 RepID=A0A3M8CWG4_9BACL|nr:N-acetyltransferase [Brevibacillus fluminis]